MKIITDNYSLLAELGKARENNSTIGFVPTMGALHQGHISLVNAAKNKENQLTVVSIFVNPTQFNVKADLDKYPRTLEKDSELLKDNGCDILYAPPTSEVYPENVTLRSEFVFNGLDEILEGEFRPGHFKGVAMVVNRLLDLIKPDNIYMGQKDLQQTLIVQSVLDQTDHKTQLRVCPIVREPHGLAMSSRNERLEPDMRINAGVLYHCLKYCKRGLGQIPVDDLKKRIFDRIRMSGLIPEYFEIVDRDSMSVKSNVRKGVRQVALIAAWAGEIRLIDNEFMNKGNLN
jgi:pantoate--beta-alanine ligase